ncbi:hypothetical protein JTB14_022350 [Gonioctena quinquepunctata]|nr:hypothetical protein JTB14_022350 [Gonioctena quinquepunctata]
MFHLHEKNWGFLGLAEFYSHDIQDFRRSILEVELCLWYQKFSKTSHQQRPRNALDALNLCNPDIYPNVFIILEIFATLPISTSSPERSFSTLRRLKSYLRNTTSENRLNGLAHLNIHREIHVDPKDVMAVLKYNGPRRLDFLL